MDIFRTLLDYKHKLNLPSPGSLEHLHKEAKGTTTFNHFFDGGKADLAKGLSPNFQVSHSFSLTAASLGAFPSAKSGYHFGALYATEHHLLHGMISGDGTLQGKYHYNPTKETSFKLHHQISSTQPAYDMLQVELDHVGSDYAVNAKAFNPSPAFANGLPSAFGLTGIFTCGFMQTIRNGLALGTELVYQRINPKEQEIGTSLNLKAWSSSRIFTVTLQQFSLLQASYWQRIGEKIEVGSEIQASLVGKRDGIATVACKLDYKQATVRGQVDTMGKVALVLEEKLAPGFSFVVCGEIDHLKDANRFGVGINMES